MEKRSIVVVASIVLAFLALAAVGVSRLIHESATGNEKQLTQKQRLKALEKLSPQSLTVRRMIAGEKANEDAQKELDQSGN